jgi:hypothetical protein
VGGGEGRGAGFDFWLFSVCLDAVSFANNIHPFDNSGLDVRRFHHHSLQTFHAICFFLKKVFINNSFGECFHHSFVTI